MIFRVLLASLAAGAVTLPVPVGAPSAAAQNPMIRSVTLRPASPVVGPTGAVRLVIEVVARGAVGPEGVTIQVEPGAPPRSGVVTFPVPAPDPPFLPGPAPASDSPSGSGPGLVSGLSPKTGPSSKVGLSSKPGPSSNAGPSFRAGLVPAPQPAPASVRGGHAVEMRVSKIASSAGQDWETWRFAPEKTLSRWYPAGRWTVTATARGAGGKTVTGYAGFWLKRETRFSSVQAVRKDSGVEVSGVLNRVDPQGYLDYAPFAGQPVKILHQARGEEDWTEAAAATTDLQGRFSRNVPDRRGGEWRIRFAGTGHYAAQLGKIHETFRSPN